MRIPALLFLFACSPVIAADCVFGPNIVGSTPPMTPGIPHYDVNMSTTFEVDYCVGQFADGVMFQSASFYWFDTHPGPMLSGAIALPSTPITSDLGGDIERQSILLDPSAIPHGDYYLGFDLWDIQPETNIQNFQEFLVTVTVVPEPTGLSLLLLVVPLARLRLRRRI